MIVTVKSQWTNNGMRYIVLCGALIVSTFKRLSDAKRAQYMLQMSGA